MTSSHRTPLALSFLSLLAIGCKSAAHDTPEYFLFRPEVERTYGYSHAVRLGDDVKISGAVSMDDRGNLVAAGDLTQQCLS